MSEPRTQDEVVEELPSGCCGHGTTPGYQVQARYIGEPKILGGVMLSKEWKTLWFPNSPVGVPTHSGPHDWYLPAAECMSYEAAQALRWWFLSVCAADILGSMCIETRLLAYRIKYSYEATEPKVIVEVKESWRP